LEAGSNRLAIRMVGGVKTRERGDCRGRVLKSIVACDSRDAPCKYQPLKKLEKWWVCGLGNLKRGSTQSKKGANLLKIQKGGCGGRLVWNQKGGEEQTEETGKKRGGRKVDKVRQRCLHSNM